MAKYRCTERGWWITLRHHIIKWQNLRFVRNFPSLSQFELLLLRPNIKINWQNYFIWSVVPVSRGFVLLWNEVSYNYCSKFVASCQFNEWKPRFNMYGCTHLCPPRSFKLRLLIALTQSVNIGHSERFLDDVSCVADCSQTATIKFCSTDESLIFCNSCVNYDGRLPM